MTPMDKSNSTLLGMAKNDLILADYIIVTYGDDEGMLNNAGYHLQQCMEKVLKHYIESAGYRFPKVHDISELCNIVEDNGVQLPFSLIPVKALAAEITAMEDKTRYIKNYSLALSRILVVQKLCHDCIAPQTYAQRTLDVIALLKQFEDGIPDSFVDGVVSAADETLTAQKLVTEVILRWEEKKLTEAGQ